MTKGEAIRRQRLSDVRRLLRSRYGPELPDDDGGREDLHELLLPISCGPHADLKMPKAIEVHAPWMGQDEAQQLIDHINRTPIYDRMPTAKQLGRRQGVTNLHRERLRLWTIAAHDMTAEEIAEQRKAKKRERMRRLRQRRGSKPRALYLANAINRKKPWLAEGKSRAAWYRKRRETGPCQVKLSITEHTPVSPSEPRRSRVGRAWSVAEHLTRTGIVGDNRAAAQSQGLTPPDSSPPRTCVMTKRQGDLFAQLQKCRLATHSRPSSEKRPYFRMPRRKGWSPPPSAPDMRAGGIRDRAARAGKEAMTSATERSRQCRERRQLGLVQFKVEVAIEPLRDLLHASGLLDEWDYENLGEIRDALEQFIATVIADAQRGK